MDSNDSKQAACILLAACFSVCLPVERRVDGVDIFLIPHRGHKGLFFAVL